MSETSQKIEALIFASSKPISENDIKIPKGCAVMGGGMYWPAEGFCLDFDIKNFSKFRSVGFV